MKGEKRLRLEACGDEMMTLVRRRDFESRGFHPNRSGRHDIQFNTNLSQRGNDKTTSSHSYLHSAGWRCTFFVPAKILVVRSHHQLLPKLRLASSHVRILHILPDGKRQHQRKVPQSYPRREDAQGIVFVTTSSIGTCHPL